MNFQNVEFELAAGRKDQLPKCTAPEIVFSGKSNVGKSSLINKLVNRKALARVSATPGKTATINFYRLPECRLVDLPGYGYAKVSKGERDRWASLVEGYFAQDRNVALVIQLVDMRHKPTADDLQMVDFLLRQFEGDTGKIWDSNMFGRSFHELVGEDLQAKLKRMPEDAREKLRDTLQRIINEGSGGLICIIL